MDEKSRVLLLQYYLFKRDCLTDDRKMAIFYLRNNNFKFDFDFISARNAILFEKFFDDIMKEIFDILEV